MATSFTNVNECETVQIVEPENDLLVDSGIGGSDPALTERGEVVLSQGQDEVQVSFTAPKLSATYRFEYLYVDDLGDTDKPGVITAVPVVQTAGGFTAELAGAPVKAGYILRWRVVVVGTLGSQIPSVQIDAPERQYLQLPWQIPPLNPIYPPSNEWGILTVVWVNPRSNSEYGFSELRVENVTDDPLYQVPIIAQVVKKETTKCAVAFYPVPQTGNYYLTVRTP